MTKEKVNQLENDVSVIKREIITFRGDVKDVKNLLRGFIFVSLTILGLIIVQIWSSAGDKKIMQSYIIHNQLVIKDMTRQGMDTGWYKPDAELISRDGKNK